MPKPSRPFVMDVYPWPNGLGFQGAPQWWEFVHDQPEATKLELLLSTALLSEEVCSLLLNHDRMLLEAFQLSEDVIVLLVKIEANTLSAFTATFLQHYKHLYPTGEDSHDNTHY